MKVTGEDEAIRCREAEVRAMVAMEVLSCCSLESKRGRDDVAEGD